MRRLAQGIAAALAMAAIVPGTASAATYAVSINKITNFDMWVTGPSISPFTFTYSNDAAALDGVGSSNVSAMDAPGACVGTACAGWENQFNAHNTVTSDFSYGDAQILSLPILGGAQGAASAIGETLSGNGIGFGMGGNTLIASFNVETAGTQLHFGFDAELFLQTVLGSGGIGAAASSAMQITINGAGYQFLWTPDGQAGGITGGNELADAFSLNQGISGTDLFTDSSASMGFHAVTNELAVGSYTMNITMTQTANVSAVPVPAALWLLGSGLLGLVAVARRRAA
jgi:hypothetical protein